MLHQQPPSWGWAEQPPQHCSAFRLLVLRKLQPLSHHGHLSKTETRSSCSMQHPQLCVVGVG